MAVGKKLAFRLHGTGFNSIAWDLDNCLLLIMAADEELYTGFDNWKLKEGFRVYVCFCVRARHSVFVCPPLLLANRCLTDYVPVT